MILLQNRSMTVATYNHPCVARDARVIGDLALIRWLRAEVLFELISFGVLKGLPRARAFPP